MEKVFKFDDKFCHFEIAVREEEVFPRLLEKYQQLVSRADIPLCERVDEFIRLLILVRMNFHFNNVYGTAI